MESSIINKGRSFITTRFFPFFVGVLIALLGDNVKCSAQPAELPVLKHNFTVIAHRGAHKTNPENTLSAFKEAIAIGADYVELDLRTSKNGKLVIMHDATVDRTTNGHGRVEDFSWRQLRRLQIHADRKHIKEHIPVFNKVLRLCKGKIYIYLDFKDANVGGTWDLINKYGMAEQIVVYCNTMKQFNEWHKVAPQMPLMISLPDTVKSVPQLVKILHANPISILDGDYQDYNANMIRAADSLGVVIWPDIQSDHESKNWEAAIKLGLNGLQTDHPEELIHWLTARKIR